MENGLEKTKSTVARTPAQRQPDVLFSPASYSQISNTPRSHKTGSGKIVCTFGNPQLLANETWTSAGHREIIVKQLLTHDGEMLTSKTKYMFDVLNERANIVGDRIFNIGKDISKRVFDPISLDYDLQNANVSSQHPIKTIGVIYSDCEGGIDASSTILVGSHEQECQIVRLNFNETQSFGIFPGQVVMVKGRNPRGDMIMVEEVVAERLLETPTLPKLHESICFVVAAGPYTLNDDFMYGPMHDLLIYCKNNRPDVFILTGPFLDSEHKMIAENVLAETFEDFFEKMIAGIMEVVGSETTVVLVPSCKDAHGDSVYPTPPLALKETYPNIYSLSDPSIVDVNGVTIGITSTDIVDHLLRNELSRNAGEKIKRAVGYLFNQKSFYPISPQTDDRLCYDCSLGSKFANIEKVPNIMILPSDQKPFLRMVNGCLAINPGRLADENGGSFARFVLHPPSKEEVGSIFNMITCQVRKI